MKETYDDDAPSLITASLCAVWIPCVVGRRSSNIFLTSAVTSLLTKVVVLVVAVCLVETDLQHHLQPRPFLLLCRQEGSPLLDKPAVKNITRCSFTDTEKYMYCFADGETNALGLKEMKKALSQMKQGHDIYSIGLETLRDPKYEFHSRERFLKLRSATEKELLDLETLKDKIITPELDNARKRNIERIGNLTEKVDEEMKEHGVGIIQQKIRVCDPDETVLRVSLYSGLAVAVLLAAYSTFSLHKITNYQTLYDR